MRRSPEPARLVRRAALARLILAAGIAASPLVPAALAAQDTTRVPRVVAAPPADTVPRTAVHERAEARAENGVRVCAGGDVTLGTNLDTGWVARVARTTGRPPGELPSADSLLRPLRPLVRGADIVLLNVEGAIGEGEVPSKCGPTSTACYAMRQPIGTAAALRALADSAVVVGNLANNHSRDAGAEGFDSTLAHLTAAGVLVTGADTLATEVVTVWGDTVAVLGFSTSGVTDLRDYRAVRRHVERAAARHARVIVTMHIGAEGAKAQRTRDSVEMFFGGDRGNPVRFADVALDAGADLVIGHGPHVVRAMRWRRGRLVAYSLGNLVTYGPFSTKPPLDRGGVLCANLADSGAVSRVHLASTRQLEAGRVRVDRTHRAARLVDSLSRLDFPHDGARVLRDGTVVPRRPPARRRPTGKKNAAPVARAAKGTND